MGVSYSKYSNDLIVPRKQPENSMKDRLLVTSMIKFVIVIFIILSVYWEHNLNRVNYATFLVIQWVLKCPLAAPPYPSSWVKNFDTLTLPARKQKIEAYWDLN